MGIGLEIGAAAAQLPRGAAAASPAGFWTPGRLRALRHGLWIPAVVTALFALADVLSGSLGLDSHAYWAAWHHHLYSAVPEQRDAYLYSPAFAEGLWPLTLLPWPLFCALWLALVASIYAWLLAPLDMRWRIPLLLLCSLDIVTGNVWSLFALVLVFGLRFPAAWAFPVLTKATPAIGPLWFLARREWRSLAIALGATAAIALVSLLAAADLWHEWETLLLHPRSIGGAGAASAALRPMVYPATAVSLTIGLPIAIGLTLYAARTTRPWLLPVAMVFAMPVLTSNALVILAAIPRMRRAAVPGVSRA
jgi:hypothetical protein